MLSRFLLQHRVDAVEPLQRRRQLLLVVGDQTGQLPRHRRGVGKQADDRLPALVEHPEQIVGVEDQRVDLLAAFGQDPGHVASGLEQLGQALVAIVERPRQSASARRTSARVGERSGRASSASVSSDWLSESVSVAAVFAVRSLTASVKEYGDDVRGRGNGLTGGRACRCPRNPRPTPARRAAFRCGCARWFPSRARTCRRW